jgi:hypothetical protein
MKKILRDNGLTIVLMIAFLFSLAGQYVTGWHEHNRDQIAHGEAAVSFVGYAASGHFIEAVFENWESEFLQMATFVILTVFLYQRGSAESRSPDTHDDRTLAEKVKNKKDLPWPVRRGGWWLKLYSVSLSIALLSLFLVSFVLHAVAGAEEYNSEIAQHGQPQTSVLGYLATSRFWFESFQNWQSEFLSIAVMVVFTIFLRQEGSAESKPIQAAHSDTGK